MCVASSRFSIAASARRAGAARPIAASRSRRWACTSTAQDFRRVMDNLVSGKSSSDYWLAGMTAPEDVAAEFPKWLDVEAGIIKPVINWEA